MTKQYKRSNLSFALLALVILLCVSWLWQADMGSQQLDYSQVRQLFLQEKVEQVDISSDYVLTMKLRGEFNGSDVVRYQLYDFQLFYDDLNDLVQEQYAKGVITSYDYPEPQTTNWLALLLPYVLVAVVLAAFWYFMMMRSQGAWDRTKWPNSAPPGPGR